jgi:hypothetical protein
MHEPLEVVAHLRGPVALPNALALDALLGWAVVVRDGLTPALSAAECVELALPLAEEPGGRFYLASVSHGEVEAHENHWLHRRHPVEVAQAMGPAEQRRVKISAGAEKSYRIPLDTVHLVGDALRWWCIGERAEVEALLSLVAYVGKRRGVGLGRVARWEVSPCEPWEGFPVVRDGQPTRSLPPDWPGLTEGVETAYRTLRPPYWDRTREVLCAVPPWAA